MNQTYHKPSSNDHSSSSRMQSRGDSHGHAIIKRTKKTQSPQLQQKRPTVNNGKQTRGKPGKDYFQDISAAVSDDDDDEYDEEYNDQIDEIECDEEEEDDSDLSEELDEDGNLKSLVYDGSDAEREFEQSYIQDNEFPSSRYKKRARVNEYDQEEDEENENDEEDDLDEVEDRYHGKRKKLSKSRPNVNIGKEIRNDPLLSTTGRNRSDNILTQDDYPIETSQDNQKLKKRRFNTVDEDVEHSIHKKIKRNVESLDDKIPSNLNINKRKAPEENHRLKKRRVNPMDEDVDDIHTEDQYDNGFVEDESTYDDNENRKKTKLSSGKNSAHHRRENVELVDVGSNSSHANSNDHQKKSKSKPKTTARRGSTSNTITRMLKKENIWVHMPVTIVDVPKKTPPVTKYVDLLALSTEIFLQQTFKRLLFLHVNANQNQIVPITEDDIWGLAVTLSYCIARDAANIAVYTTSKNSIAE